MRIGLNSKQTQNHFLFTRVLTIKNNASLWSWSIIFSTNTVIQGKLHEIYQFHTLLETQFTSFIFSVQDINIYEQSYEQSWIIVLVENRKSHKY